MSIPNNKHISVQETTWIDISVPPELKEEFKEMVRRSMNTWQNASEPMRKFADRILEREAIMKATYKSVPLTEDPAILSLCTECYQIPCICACTAA